MSQENYSQVLKQNNVTIHRKERRVHEERWEKNMEKIITFFFRIIYNILKKTK